MKTRIMILACLLAVPAGAWQHNNRLTLNRKLQYRHKETPSSSGKEKETCASRCTKSSWKTARKRSANLRRSLSREGGCRQAYFPRCPAIHPPKRRYNAYEPHCSGLFIGYSRLADDFLSFGASDKMGLDLSKSWEFGFNILSVYHNFKKNPHWGINLGVSWGYRSFNIDGNYAY